MSKKHFIALADMIRAYACPARQVFNQETIERLADFCESQNPQFNRERWLAYIAGKCGPNGGKR